eukprot:356840-Chlamydomonas_euryale.AAC.4
MPQRFFCNVSWYGIPSATFLMPPRSDGVEVDFLVPSLIAAAPSAVFLVWPCSYEGQGQL